MTRWSLSASATCGSMPTSASLHHSLSEDNSVMNNFREDSGRRANAKAKALAGHKVFHELVHID